MSRCSFSGRCGSSQRATQFWVGLVGALAVVGCGPSEPPRVGISGMITLDQAMVGPVLVTLIPTESTQVGCTFSTTDGNFVVPAESGPSPGRFQVVVSSLEPDLEEFEARRSLNQNPLSRVKLPAKYARPGELHCEIQPGSDEPLLLTLHSQ